ncbi:uncharacterized protein LOC135114416 [Scylla paramamosain]|uniref:uncharacterized protein LOC135114416 n=1 Tax=Scylla paramamosain TaxID=85552 RepID=UPI003082EEA7
MRPLFDGDTGGGDAGGPPLLPENDNPRSHQAPLTPRGGRPQADLTYLTEEEIEAALSIPAETKFGFRKERSAADVNLLLANDWSNVLDQGRHMAVLALDITGVFDRVWHSVLVERLRAVCCFRC